MEDSTQNGNIDTGQNSPGADSDGLPPKSEPDSGSSRFTRFKSWYVQRKMWSIPASVLLFLIILFLVPWTRYPIAALFIKQDFTIQVVDSETNTPVSGADVSMVLKTVQTDGSGKATVKQVKPGKHSVLVHKKYYSALMTYATVPVLKQKTTKIFKFQATGRQAKVTIKNLVSQAALPGVLIKMEDTTAKTDNNGVAVVVVPTGITSQKATLSLDGYNSQDVQVKASDSKIEDNQFQLTPSGKIYFLSKLSGKIDVVKTNLDGSQRQTVLAGTGNEDDTNTVLLASRDWKYLALLSRRAGSSSTLYLIDTSDDSLTTIEEGSISLKLVGWDDHRFVYVLTRNTINNWQLGKETLKSYNAESKSAILLDQTAASGSDQSDYIRETYGDELELNNGEVVYSKNWISAFNNANQAAILAKQATLNSINADGSNHKAVKGFSLAAGTQALSVSIDMKPHKPNSVYINFEDGTKATIYEYANGQVTNPNGVSSDSFYAANYPTYLISPTGNLAFWSEPRDGKNTLFIGDQNGANGKQIATLSDYSNYGWFSDNYLLVSKNSSELYIMSKDGTKPAVKITDYHKPAQNYYGYGGGYGGL